MITETSDITVFPDPVRPMNTNVAHLTLPRVGARFPNIRITMRYRLVPKTGLFFYEKEEDVEFVFTPIGWDSTGSFTAPITELQRTMQRGNRVLDFSTFIYIAFHDAKISVNIFGSSADFTPPKQQDVIKIEGHVNTRGLGGAKSILQK